MPKQGHHPEPEGLIYPVFVYGTLMHGERNFKQYLQGVGAKFMRAARTASSDFKMVVNPSSSSPGKFTPSVYRDPSGRRIDGQLFKVSRKALKMLDSLEKYYDRKLVRMENGSKAWMYFKKDRPEQAKDASPFLRVNRNSNDFGWMELNR